MTTPVFSPVNLQTGTTAFDASIQRNFQLFRKHFREPLPVHRVANVAALPSAATWDRCLVLVESDPDNRPSLYSSNGATWFRLFYAGTQKYILAVEKRAYNANSVTSLDKRMLTDILVDETGGASLSDGGIILPVGNYRCRITASARWLRENQVILWGVVSTGLSCVSGNPFLPIDTEQALAGYAYLSGRFLQADSTPVEIAHRKAGTIPEEGEYYGAPAAKEGNNNIYVAAEFWQE